MQEVTLIADVLVCIAVWDEQSIVFATYIHVCM